MKSSSQYKEIIKVFPGHQRTSVSKIKAELTTKWLKTYSVGEYSYINICSTNLIFNEKCFIVAKFKDFLILDDATEFAKRFYRKYESKPRLRKLLSFYSTYSKIFPNYMILPENEYWYKNIRKKQKMIDGWNKIKQEEAENRQKMKWNTIKSSKQKLQVIPSKNQNNIVFTNQVNQSIQRCKSSVHDDWVDNSVSISIVYKKLSNDISNDLSALESGINETNEDIRDILGDWKQQIDAAENNYEITYYNNSDNIKTINNCNLNYINNGKRKGAVSGCLKQGKNDKVPRVLKTSRKADINNNINSQALKIINNYHNIYVPPGNTIININNNCFQCGNNTSSSNSKNDNQSNPCASARSKDIRVLSKERDRDNHFSKWTKNLTINNVMWSPTLISASTKILFNLQNTNQREKESAMRETQTISASKRKYFSPIAKHKINTNTLTKSAPRGSKMNREKQNQAQKFQTISTGRSTKSNYSSKLNLNSNLQKPLDTLSKDNTGIKTFKSISVLNTVKTTVCSPTSSITLQLGANSPKDRIGKTISNRLKQNLDIYTMKEWDKATTKCSSPVITKPSSKVIAPSMKDRYKFWLSSNNTSNNNTYLSKQDKTVSTNRSLSRKTLTSQGKISSEKNMKPLNYLKKNIKKPKQLTLVNTNQSIKTSSTMNVLRELAISPFHSATPSAILGNSDSSQQPTIRWIRVNRKSNSSNIISS